MNGDDYLEAITVDGIRSDRHRSVSATRHLFQLIDDVTETTNAFGDDRLPDSAWQYTPGPPINENAWLHGTIIADVEGGDYYDHGGKINRS